PAPRFSTVYYSHRSRPTVRFPLRRFPDHGRSLSAQALDHTMTYSLCQSRSGRLNLEVDLDRRGAGKHSRLCTPQPASHRETVTAKGRTAEDRMRITLLECLIWSGGVSRGSWGSRSRSRSSSGSGHEKSSIALFQLCD